MNIYLSPLRVSSCLTSLATLEEGSWTPEVLALQKYLHPKKQYHGD